MKLSLQQKITSPYFIIYILTVILIILLFSLNIFSFGYGWKFLIILLYLPIGSIVAHTLTKKRIRNKKDKM